MHIPVAGEPRYVFKPIVQRRYQSILGAVANLLVLVLKDQHDVSD